MQFRFRPLLVVALTAVIALGAISAPARADDTARVVQLLKPMLAVTSYRMKMTSNVRGTSRTTTMLFVAPDRISSSGSGMDLISIGSKTWMRTPGSSTWMPSPISMGSMVAQYRDPANLQKLTSGMHASYTDAGMGSYQGRPAHLFKSTSTVAGRLSHATLYILDDHLVHHMDIVSSNGTTMSIDYSDFNSKAISIQAPA